MLKVLMIASFVRRGHMPGFPVNSEQDDPIWCERCSVYGARVIRDKLHLVRVNGVKTHVHRHIR
jgi:hypothetical protein